ncbi:AzlC family ABC transporter permease (plasmid) [Paracoccus sp. TK19116]|uniref:AzlC family ABC transporter permease n=1 Tax=Paracoccus albicereus TaxID=2922394 RepID=A0ABT1MMK2_9RHOB|nr:AzlC family ABC transporter permease [Paracoccus albicereus]MCQ0969004.1 AzlC family ABC transporter permease [Paracoccus albicereus]
MAPPIPHRPEIAPDAPSAARKPVDPRSTRQIFTAGLIQAAPLMLVIVPFAMLFGVVGSDAGLSLAQIMGFSTLVLAGASQFTAVQLINDNVPLVLIFISALAVNLRMAMYSASLVPWYGQAGLRDRALMSFLLVDQTYVLGLAFSEANPDTTLRQRLAYFHGTALPICLGWVVFTYVGVAVGNLIPESWPLDFALPITFLAMIAPMLRTSAHRLAALTAVVVALLLVWMPSGLGLLIASGAGMAVGAWVETRAERSHAVRSEAGT